MIDTTRSLLTGRQLMVVQLVANGLANEEIATNLRVGTATVQRHVENARWTLQARNRAHLAAIAVRTGLI